MKVVAQMKDIFNYAYGEDDYFEVELIDKPPNPNEGKIRIRLHPEGGEYEYDADPVEIDQFLMDFYSVGKNKRNKLYNEFKQGKEFKRLADYMRTPSISDVYPLTDELMEGTGKIGQDDEDNGDKGTIRRMTERGLSNKQIAEELGIDERELGQMYGGYWPTEKEDQEKESTRTWNLLRTITEAEKAAKVAFKRGDIIEYSSSMFGDIAEGEVQWSSALGDYLEVRRMDTGEVEAINPSQIKRKLIRMGQSTESNPYKMDDMVAPSRKPDVNRFMIYDIPQVQLEDNQADPAHWDSQIGFDQTMSESEQAELPMVR